MKNYFFFGWDEKWEDGKYISLLSCQIRKIKNKKIKNQNKCKKKGINKIIKKKKNLKKEWEVPEKDKNQISKNRKPKEINNKLKKMSNRKNWKPKGKKQLHKGSHVVWSPGGFLVRIFCNGFLLSFLVNLRRKHFSGSEKKIPRPYQYFIIPFSPTKHL